MTRLRFFGMLGLVALFLLPAADAQQRSVFSLQIRAPDREIAPGGIGNATGTLRYTMDDSAILQLGGIPVVYRVTHSPIWASVVVSPSTDIIPTDQIQPAITMSGVRFLHVDIYLSHNATPGDLDSVEITATTYPGTFDVPRTVRTSFVLPVAGDPCPQAAAASAAPAPATSTPPPAPPGAAPQAPVSSGEAAPPTPVRVQSAGATVAPVSGLAVAGFALVGAAAGFALKRRAK